MKNFFEQKKERENSTQILKDILAHQSLQTNEALQNHYKLDAVLNADVTLDPAGYEAIYGKESLQEDAIFVRERELDFSAANNPNVQAFYEEKYDAKTQDEIIAQWRKNKTNEKNGQMEMAVTALLSQKLGKNFLVVRTAAYDDYKNGVDNLILDRTTGEVVGAFDEVHEGGAGDRTKEKELKIKKIAQRGGATIKYGLQYVKDTIVRAGLEGVPVFYLGLESAKLLELVRGLADNDVKTTDEIFKQLIASLSTQYVALEQAARTPSLRARLTSFKKSLEQFEKQQFKTHVEEINDAVVKSPECIEKEFAETQNSWLACLGSRVFIVETYLCSKKTQEELGQELYAQAQGKLEALKQKLFNLKEQYPDKNTIPPKEIKQELLAMLDVLK